MKPDMPGLPLFNGCKKLWPIVINIEYFELVGKRLYYSSLMSAISIMSLIIKTIMTIESDLQ